MRSVFLSLILLFIHSFSCFAQQTNAPSAKKEPAGVIEIAPKVPEDTAAFRAVQQLAVSGFNISQFIASNFSYPPEVFDDSNFVAVKVLVEFIVEKDARISTISIKKLTNLGSAGLQPNTEKLLKMEVIRVMRKMPKWASPAYQEGEAVRSYFNLPIHLKYN